MHAKAGHGKFKSNPISYRPWFGVSEFCSRVPGFCGNIFYDGELWPCILSSKLRKQSKATIFSHNLSTQYN